LKSVLVNTPPNYQDCIVEEANIAPHLTVYPTEDHSPNGVKMATAEAPLGNVASPEFKLGVVEIEEIRPETQDKYDRTTVYTDNNHCNVHWLKPGDKFVAKITDPAATIARGKQMVLGGAGLWKKPDANTTYDLGAYQTCAVERTLVTGDTYGILMYVGLAGLDLA
jgi:hypothetical protein